MSTAVWCGSAVATVGPVIKAKDEDIAYAISSTFVFDVITVVALPWIGLALGMSNMGYGLWVGLRLTTHLRWWQQAMPSLSSPATQQ